jgi:hypothetical protein
LQSGSHRLYTEVDEPEEQIRADPSVAAVIGYQLRLIPALFQVFPFPAKSKKKTLYFSA